MGLNISRSIEIQISNKTKKITLRNPRIYFFSGHSLKTPEPSVAPGSSSTCKFINNTWLWGCNGVLAFEAKTFTLAIYFSNPIDYNRFSPETGLELSRDKVHKGDLKETYDRLVRISSCSDSSTNPRDMRSIILKGSQETAQLNAGPVKLTVTMSWAPDAVIKVTVEEQKSPSSKKERKTKARVESPCRARHVQEK